MGHYDSNAEKTVYSQFRAHCSAPRCNTDLNLTEAIRATHPDSHVAWISNDTCDLVKFLEAHAHGSVSLKTEDDKCLIGRVWQSPSNRLEGGNGKLNDDVHFGYYEGEWRGTKVRFYLCQWLEEMRGTVEINYILSPKSSVDANGHSPESDDLLLAASKWTSDLHEEIYVFDSGHWDKSSHLWKAVQNSTWDDVILDPQMKSTLITDVQSFFDSRAVYEEYAVPWKRGIIFHGTPGCGKTISIKALMNSLEKRDPPVASLYVKSFEACQGEQYSIRSIFRRARAMAPCLLIFEDLDSLVVDEVRSYFLNEVDGLEDNNGILMIGSTNHLERLDPGISKRPSRFDRKYFFRLPGERERILYCEYWKKKLEKNSRVDFDPEICSVVAKFTEGFSFAYLKELFVQTLLTIVGGREDAEMTEMTEEQVSAKAEDTKPVAESAKLLAGDEKIESSTEEGKETLDGETAKDDSPSTETREQRKMPEVEIPDSIKDNPLMKILHKQFIALWNDMDNSMDAESGNKTFGDEAPVTNPRAGLKKAMRAVRMASDEAEEDYALQLRLLEMQNAR